MVLVSILRALAIRAQAEEKSWREMGDWQGQALAKISRKASDQGGGSMKIPGDRTEQARGGCRPKLVNSRGSF